MTPLCKPSPKDPHGLVCTADEQERFALPLLSAGRFDSVYGTHGTPEVKDWLNRHPRFKVHYVPTSSSWLNLIERWFGELTSKRIRRDSFLSVDELIAAINEFLAAWNENPRPFVWTATVESIVGKLARCRQTLEQIQPGCTTPKTRKRKAS